MRTRRMIRSPVGLDAIIDGLAESVAVVDSDGRLVYANQAAAQALGFASVEALLAASTEEILSDLDLFDTSGTPISRNELYGLRILARVEPGEAQICVRNRLTGDERWLRVRGRQIQDDSTGPSYAVVAFREVTEEVRQEHEVKKRTRQQAAVADLGLQALGGADLDDLFENAARLVADGLEVEFSQVLELMPGGERLLLKAGVGWQPGLTGTATVGADLDSQGGYTLREREPVVVEDLGDESRFVGSPLLSNHGVVSGISVVIGDTASPYGVLGAYASQKRRFGRDDVHFLQSVANVIGETIEKRRRDEEVRFQTRLLDAVGESVVATDLEGRLLYWNRAAQEASGWSAEEALGRRVTEVTPVFQVDADIAELRESVLTGESWSGEFRITRKDGSAYPALVKISGIRNQRGQVTGLIGVIIDITEGKAAEERLRAQYDVGTVLAGAATLEEAAPAILEIVCDHLDWDVSNIWTSDDKAGVLRCSASTSRVEASAFMDETRSARFRVGNGMPGQVWLTGEPTWITDLANYEHFTRKSGLQAGLKTGIAVPVRIASDIYAVVEFFSKERRERDEALLTTLATIGAQLGHFIERKRAEAALKESEERYRVLVEHSPAPILVHQDRAVVYANPAATALLGARSSQELLGRNVLSLVHPAYHQVMEARIEQVVEQGRHAELVQERFIRLDGQMMDVEVVSMPATFNDRPASQIVMRDVTERNRAEAALREAEEKYRGIFENAVVGIFQTTPDGKFVAANEHLARIFGFDSADDLVNSVTDIAREIHVDPKARADFARRLETEKVVTNFEVKAYRRDREIIDISLTGRVIEDEEGNVLGYEGMIQDITARKYADERVREQARIIETIEEVAGSVAAELDFDSAAQAVTDAARDLTGAQFAAFFYSKEDESDEYFNLYTISGGDRSAFAEYPMPRNTLLFGPTFRGEEVIRADDVLIDHRYGKTGPHFGMPEGHLPVRSYLAVPVFSRSGEVMGGLFLGHEQTGRFNEKHEALVRGIARWAGIAVDNARLYQQAQEVQGELRKLNEAKDEFLGLVSHELRTPITTIYGGARLLQSRRGSIDEQRAAEILLDIEQESERMFRLVEDMLALARLELGEKMALKPTDLGPVIERVVSGFARRRPGRKVAVDVEDELPPALLETTYVEQVLRNLLSNADKYSTPEQAVELQVRRTAPEEATITVMDRGSGVSPEELDRLFERFYRAQSTSRQAAGLGIGLTVCQRLVEAQGGRVWAELRDGGGLSISFTVALASKAVEVGG
jgi:PAS domain S-box-containing protein